MWKMKLSEATIAPASQDMKETTALQPNRPARQMPACANMGGSVSGGIPTTRVCVLFSTQDNSANWSHTFLFSTRKHLLVLIITASMESALHRKVLTMVTHASVMQDTQVLIIFLELNNIILIEYFQVTTVSTSQQCSWLDKTHTLNWIHSSLIEP